MLIHKESIKNNYNYKGKTKMEIINDYCIKIVTGQY